MTEGVNCDALMYFRDSINERLGVERESQLNHSNVNETITEKCLCDLRQCNKESELLAIASMLVLAVLEDEAFSPYNTIVALTALDDFLRSNQATIIYDSVDLARKLKRIEVSARYLSKGDVAANFQHWISSYVIQDLTAAS